MKNHHWNSPSSHEDDGELNSMRAFADLMVNLFVTTLVLLMAIIAFVGEKSKAEDPDQKVFFVSTVWDVCLDPARDGRKPGQSAADIDLYAKLVRPGEAPDIIGYSSPSRKSKYFILNQDDLGGSHTDVDDVDEEIITSRGAILHDGSYTVNLQLYGDKGEFARKGGKPICSRTIVIINRGLPGEQKVCDNVVELKRPREEQTACRFNVKDGKVEILPNLFSPIKGGGMR